MQVCRLDTPGSRLAEHLQGRVLAVMAQPVREVRELVVVADKLPVKLNGGFDRVTALAVLFAKARLDTELALD